MDSSTAWSAESREAMAAVAESTAVLASYFGADAERAEGPDGGLPPGADPLRELADDCLDALAELARQEAGPLL
jgi:hypothetical protein